MTVLGVVAGKLEAALVIGGPGILGVGGVDHQHHVRGQAVAQALKLGRTR